MSAVQMWRRLDVPGHDVARIDRDGDGWLLVGQATFLATGDGATTVTYRLGLDAGWATLWGEIEGFSATRRFRHEVRREGRRWTLDGQAAPEAEGLFDLDLGFTPATNMPQVKRMNLAIGEATEITVAWFDVEGGGSGGLRPLLQRYRRTGERTYAYESPDGDYAATLVMADNGFCIDYPGLWAGETGLV